MNLNNNPQTSISTFIYQNLEQSVLEADQFTDDSPDAQVLVTAKFDGPKADIKLNINHEGIVQKKDHIPSTPSLGSKSVQDPKTNEWTRESAVINNNIYATTIVANINTYHTLNIDLTTTGNAIPGNGAKTAGTCGTR